MEKKVEKHGKTFIDKDGKEIKSLWNNWNITQEWIDGIKAGNQDCVFAFYKEKDNFRHLRRLVCRYVMRYRRLKGCYYDVLQTIYLDLPLFDFKSESAFYGFLMNSARLSPFGGITIVKDLDKKYMNSSYHLGFSSIEKKCSAGKNRHKDEEHDFSLLSLPKYSVKSAEKEFFKEKDKVPIYLLNVLKQYLSNKQYECFKLKLLGFENIAIRTELNWSINNAGFNYSSGRQALIRHYSEIVKTLYKKGKVTSYYLNLIPDDYEHCCKKNEERLERLRLASAKNYAKSKKINL